MLGLVAAGNARDCERSRQQSRRQPNVVSAVPRRYTPDVNNGVVYAHRAGRQRDDLGWHLHLGQPAQTHGTIYPAQLRRGFNATRCRCDNTGFAPTVNGEVDTVIPGPAANEVYIGGDFTTVNGGQCTVALLNTTTGAIVPRLEAAGAERAWSTSCVLRRRPAVRRRLLHHRERCGHDGLVALNPTTGAVTSTSTLAFTGHHNYGTQCDPTTNTCADAGVGRQVLRHQPAGHADGRDRQLHQRATASPRDQVALIDLGATSATVDPNWSTQAYTAACFGGLVRQLHPRRPVLPGRLVLRRSSRPAAAAPTATAPTPRATPRRGTRPNGSGTNVRPTWIDYTGQDTLWSASRSPAPRSTSVATSAGSTTPRARTAPGAGAVPRPGIAALDPTERDPAVLEPRPQPAWRGRVRAARDRHRALGRQRHRLHRQLQPAAPEDRVLPAGRRGDAGAQHHRNAAR